MGGDRPGDGGGGAPPHIRMEEAFAAAKGRAALCMFLTAGFPDAESTAGLLGVMADSGADVIELGIPFSDPVADGAAIQHSSEVALANGATPWGALDAAAAFRSSHPGTPVVLMGYANSYASGGLDRFCERAGQAGADGAIVVDLPLEMADEWRGTLSRHGLAMVLLASPTTGEERMRRIAAATEGYLYCVSLKGVTGADSLDVGQVARQVEALRGSTSLPVLVGFGIRTAEQARQIASVADGIVVGSGLVDTIRSAPAGQVDQAVGKYVSELRRACERA